MTAAPCFLQLSTVFSIIWHFLLLTLFLLPKLCPEQKFGLGLSCCGLLMSGETEQGSGEKSARQTGKLSLQPCAAQLCKALLSVLSRLRASAASRLSQLGSKATQSVVSTLQDSWRKVRQRSGKLISLGHTLLQFWIMRFDYEPRTNSFWTVVVDQLVNHLK